MHDTLQRLFRYKAWANEELLTTLAGLGGESPITPLAINALSHSYIVDRIFAAHLRREPHAYTSANSSELPALEKLSADIRKSDREYVDYASGLAGDQLAERSAQSCCSTPFRRRRMVSRPTCTRPRRRRDGGLPGRVASHRSHVEWTCWVSRRTISVDSCCWV